MDVINEKALKNDVFKRKTKKLALEMMNFVEFIPKNNKGRIIENQLLRSAFPVASNYRAVCIAKTKPDFINKLGIVHEEADETQFWIELLVESGMVSKEASEKIYNDVSEIVAIVVASIKTAKKNIK